MAAGGGGKEAAARRAAAVLTEMRRMRHQIDDAAARLEQEIQLASADIDAAVRSDLVRQPKTPTPPGEDEGSLRRATPPPRVRQYTHLLASLS